MSSIGLFEAVGVELEYMIVDEETLDVLPVADELMEMEAGEPGADVDRGEAAWSNELVLHVLEIKTNGPADGLAGLAALFRDEVRYASTRLEALGGRLMPGGMHPWMDPARETELWPHEYNEVYRTFDRIFGCTGHGWANLQSTHLNLPFDGDEEFRALHAAIRAVLPLIPALAAASPAWDGRVGSALDGRIEAYRKNAVRVPSVSGAVVPEIVRSRDEYEREILGRIYKDLEPHDPDGILRHEWANARGAIARFDRGTIEIRLVDAQEGPTADLAVTAAIHGAVRWLTLDPPEGMEGLEALDTERLAHTLKATAVQADEAVVGDGALLRALGLGSSEARAGAVWEHLIDRGVAQDGDVAEWAEALDAILRWGPLARRLRSALGDAPDRSALERVWRRLCDGMVADRPFA